MADATDRIPDAPARRFRPYPEYKDSGVEWLGEIPEHWEVKRLKCVASVNDEVLAESTDPSFELSYVDISSVDSDAGITNTEELVFEKAPSRARRLVRDGDVVVSTVRTYLRAIAAIEDPKPNLIVSTGFAVIRPRQLDSSFAAYALRAPYFVERVVANSVGVSYPAINASELVCFPIVFPSTDEQHAIAAFLNRETARIDSLVAKKERLIELLQEKRTALITRAVTRGLDPGVPMKDSGVEWLGEIPEHWEVAPIYARYEVALGKMLDAKRVSGAHPGRYVRNVDVQWDRVNTRNLPQMDFAPSERQRYSLRHGDLLVCEGGEVGRTAVWRGEAEECFYQKAIHRVRPRSGADMPRFLFYVMYATAKRGVFAAGGNPNTIDHLTAVQLRHYRFAFPPGDEQKEVAAFLDRETARLDSLITKIRSAIALLKEYRTALISAAVTGKIDVRQELA
ncbi:MAG: hypothetical protein GF330_14490 [Candidatus Eisenbacteria bacterium]|nr:hypothetical protein [Candidatus Eisenbacteria bacterium]